MDGIENGDLGSGTIGRPMNSIIAIETTSLSEDVTDYVDEKPSSIKSIPLDQVSLASFDKSLERRIRPQSILVENSRVATPSSFNTFENGNSSVLEDDSDPPARTLERPKKRASKKKPLVNLENAPVDTVSRSRSTRLSRNYSKNDVIRPTPSYESLSRASSIRFSKISRNNSKVSRTNSVKANLNNYSSISRSESVKMPMDVSRSNSKLARSSSRKQKPLITFDDMDTSLSKEEQREKARLLKLEEKKQQELEKQQVLRRVSRHRKKGSKENLKSRVSNTKANKESQSKTSSSDDDVPIAQMALQALQTSLHKK